MKALVVASTGRDRNIDRAAFEGNHRSSSRFCDQLQIDLWILNFELSSHWTEPWVSRIALGSKTKFYVRQHGIVGEFLFHQFHLLKNRGCRNLKTLADWGQKHAPTRSIEQCFIHSTLELIKHCSIDLVGACFSCHARSNTITVLAMEQMNSYHTYYAHHQYN